MIRLLVILLLAASLFLAGPLFAASVTLRWTAPGDDGTTGTARQYDIRYSTSPISDANWSSAVQVPGEPTPQAAGSQESFIVSGLKSATTYYFAIKTSDESPNWSTLSNVAKKSTCPSCVGSSGNVNGSADGRVDLSDLVLLQGYIMGNPASVSAICLDAANCDGSLDGRIDLSDFSTLVNFLFGSAQLASCSQ